MALISLCVGLIVSLIGILRLGFFLDYVSAPVLKGFTMAACTITILAVFKDILGIHAAKSQQLHIVFENLIAAVEVHFVKLNLFEHSKLSLLHALMISCFYAIFV